MMQQVIPDIFKELIEQPLNRLVEEARAGGRRTIGYTCSYVPEPLIGVEGLVPVRVHAPGVSGTPMSDTYLSSVICSYTRSLLEFALDGCYDTLDGWVFTASCDHLRRLYDNLEYLVKPPFNYIIDLPHKLGGEALDWFVDELKLLADSIADHFGVDTGNDALSAAIRKQNEYLGILGAIGDLRKLDHPSISGTDFHSLVVACAASPKDLIIGSLRELKDTLSRQDGIEDYRARLMIVGSQLDKPEYLGVIESMGGLVVADRYCLGSIPGMTQIPDTGSPLRSLAEYYLRKTSCPRMMEEFDSRVNDILHSAEEYKADGIIVETVKFCDCWGMESILLVPALREAGMKVLRLEREYALTGEGQLRTRIQAFLESMGK